MPEKHELRFVIHTVRYTKAPGEDKAIKKKTLQQYNGSAWVNVPVVHEEEEWYDNAIDRNPRQRPPGVRKIPNRGQ